MHREVANILCSIHPALIEWRILNAIQRNTPRAMREHNVPGLQVALAIDDRPIRTYNAGTLHNTPSSPPITNTTRFRAGSLAKTFTAYTALRLVDQGTLSLDESLEPDLAPLLHPVLAPETHHHLKALTLRHLLSHTSGLATRHSPLLPHSHPHASITQVIQGTFGPAHIPAFEHPPGTLSMYSGSNFALIQALVESRTNQPFPTVAHTTTIQPLGLTQTHYQLHPSAEPTPHPPADFATPHAADGSPLEDHWTPCSGSSGLFTTATDYAHALRSIFHPTPGTPNFLSPTTRQTLSTPQPPTLPGAHFTTGLHLYKEIDPRTLAHGGFLPGMRALIITAPRARISLAALTNGDLGLKVLHTFIGLTRNLAITRLRESTAVLPFLHPAPAPIR